MAAPKWKPAPLTQKELSSIQSMAGFGLTVDKIAACLGMSKKTLERRMKSQPETRDALLKGRSLAEANVTQALYEMAISKKCPAATIFWVKCRARWSEPKEVEQEPTKNEDRIYDTKWGSSSAAKKHS